MQWKYIKASCLLTAVLLVFRAVLFAQNAVIVIGTIVHSNNVPAVNVYISIAGVGRYTDVQGRYRLDGVPLGHQEMRVEDPGQSGRVLLDKWVDITGSMPRINQKLVD